jgi:hypothetical protein
MCEKHMRREGDMMNTSKSDMIPHIEKAINALEMMRALASGAFKVSAEKRIPVYYESLMESIAALQDVMLTDQEYTERLGIGMALVNKGREYVCAARENTAKEVFYQVDALIPLRKMKQHAIFTGKRADVVQ